jgi:hypothetical protein
MDIVCPQCGKPHNIEEMEPSYRRPDVFLLIPQEERESRVVDSKDDCMIWSPCEQRAHCFLRTLMPFTVRGVDRPYSWGVWVEVSFDDFKRVKELWNDPNQSSVPPFAGRLANAIHCYPESLGLAGTAHLVSPQQIPWFRLDPTTEHPLVRDQNREVSPEETLQWLGPFLHSS